MKTFQIHSKRHGKFTVLLDDKDFDRVVSFGKWHVAKRCRTFYVARTYYPEGGGRKAKKKLVYLHNFILGFKGVDHIDGDGLNNCRENLRAATEGQNRQNMQVSTRNKSGYKNVWWDASKKSWLVNIRLNDKSKYIGNYKSLDDAVVAARVARAKYHPFVNEARHGTLIPRVDHHTVVEEKVA